MLATLHKLGVVPSFSRPSVSNDNPYSESLFRTLKYRPEYPSKPFDNIELAQSWVDGFVFWYNTQHLHSSIRYVTPDDRHHGREELILANREKVYDRARKWVMGNCLEINPAPCFFRSLSDNMQYSHGRYTLINRRYSFQPVLSPRLWVFVVLSWQ